MSWTQVSVLALLAALLVLTVSSGAEGAAVPADAKPADAKPTEAKPTEAKPTEARGAARRVFMPGADASSFFKRRGRRSTNYQEYQAEQRVRMQADERRKEYNEEQRNEYSNYVEDAREEQNERMRETNEQYREYHYDGVYPRYYWNH